MHYIREWITFSGKTLQAIGEELDPPASAGTVHSYGSGKRRPSQKRLADLARVLGTTPGKLLDEPPPGVDNEERKVVRLWGTIPKSRRPHALAILETFAKDATGEQ